MSFARRFISLVLDATRPSASDTNRGDITIVRGDDATVGDKVCWSGHDASGTASWNEWESGTTLTGPTGPTGATGATGATGPTGPTGPAPSGTGILAVSGGALTSPRTIMGATGVNVSNGNGAAGNPTIYLNGTAKVQLSQAKNSGFTALDSGFHTMDSFTIGPFANGVTFDCEMDVRLRLSLDSGMTGNAVAYARIATDAEVAGMETGTINGERSCHAVAFKAIVGDGVTTYTVYGRAKMDTAGQTGTCSSSLLIFRATPRT